MLGSKMSASMNGEAEKRRRRGPCRPPAARAAPHEGQIFARLRLAACKPTLSEARFKVDFDASSSLSGASDARVARARLKSVRSTYCTSVVAARRFFAVAAAACTCAEYLGRLASESAGPHALYCWAARVALWDRCCFEAPSRSTAAGASPSEVHGAFFVRSAFRVLERDPTLTPHLPSTICTVFIGP